MTNPQQTVPATGDGALRLVKKFRRPAFWLVALAACGLLAVSASAWQNAVAPIIMRNLGAVLLLVCALGRLWSSLYIVGYKNDRLITAGPYSLVRNPLYVFSFCGALGMGLSAESLYVVALLIIPFLVWFPIMVIEEERFLAGRYPDEWTAYTQTTPRFIPALRAPVVPESYTVNARRLGHAFMDAIWFPIGGLAMQGVVQLHQANVLPNLWKIY
jgi:protein-S-isoprenylcysteine O-methyltransferase Ste14